MLVKRPGTAKKPEEAAQKSGAQSNEKDKLTYDEIVKLAQDRGPVENRVSRRFSGRVAELLATE